MGKEIYVRGKTGCVKVGRHGFSGGSVSSFEWLDGALELKGTGHMDRIKVTWTHGQDQSQGLTGWGLEEFGPYPAGVE